MKLSVLMCTIPERDATELRSYLNDDRIEFITLGDNMRMTLGSKRQRLLEIATGDYVTFVDDDDKLDPSYLNSILEAVESGSDVINFVVAYSKNGGTEKPVYYSKRYKRDSNQPNHFERIPNHIMCVKREIALRVGYKDMDYGEDADYSKRLLPLLKTETNINKVLYHYLDNDKISKSQFNHRRRRQPNIKRLH